MHTKSSFSKSIQLKYTDDIELRIYNEQYKNNYNFSREDRARKGIYYIKKALTQKNKIAEIDDKAGKAECYANLSLITVNLFDYKKGLELSK